jgi:hypothetical protein
MSRREELSAYGSQLPAKNKGKKIYTCRAHILYRNLIKRRKLQFLHALFVKNLGCGECFG